MVRRSTVRTAVAVVLLVLLGGCVPHPAQPEPAGSPAPAPAKAPTRIAIDHDDHHARFVGHRADGSQFFLTEPFDPGTYEGGDARVFVALYLFDADGSFRSAAVDQVGKGDRPDPRARRAAVEAHLTRLGDVTYDRIEVEPFSVRRFGLTFGLIVNEPDGDDTWWVTAEPGDYMAFSPPWDGGGYDT